MNEPLINHPDRRFRVWAYTAGMGRLTPRAETGPLLCDIKFFEIECAGRRGYVVPGVIAKDEDEGEYYELSEYWRRDWGL